MIKEVEIKLTNREKRMCEEICDPYTQQLPLFFGYSNTNEGKRTGPVFTHFLRLTQPDDNEGIPNSQYRQEFESIFNRYCSENNIKVDRILRSAINFTTHEPDDTVTYIHTDHNFPHHAFLMYLNDFDDGPTYFYDDDGKVIYKSLPKKYNAILSDGEKHSQGYCATQQTRIVLVITYV